MTNVSNLATASCALELDWSAATPNCGGSAAYSVYRSTSSGFTPDPGNRLASGLAATTLGDSGMQSGVDYFYVVRAPDTGNAFEERWDGGVVPISTDGGGSWSTLDLDQGYPGTFRASSPVPSEEAVFWARRAN